MTETGSVVGLDIGDVRIGVAVSDPLGIIASPHSVISSTTPEADAAAIVEIVKARHANIIVVGLPLDQNGNVGPQAQKVLDFVEVLRAATGAEIVTQDERFSTAAAERMLIQADVSRRGRKKVIDKVAAQQILQVYLDRRANLRKRES